MQTVQTVQTVHHRHHRGPRRAHRDPQLSPPRRWGRAGLLALALACVGAAAGPPAAAAPLPPAPGTSAGRAVYVALGDSFTQGWGVRARRLQSYPAVLDRRFAPAPLLRNLAQGGATSASLLATELPAALAARPTVVTLWIGANDLAEGVPAAAYRAHVAAMLRAFQRRRVRVFVGTMPAVLRMPQPSCAWPQPARAARLARAYNRALASEAAARGATLVDIAAATRAIWRRPRERADCFHLDARGYATVAAVFYRRMATAAPPAAASRRGGRVNVPRAWPCWVGTIPRAKCPSAVPAPLDSGSGGGPRPSESERALRPVI